jgi:hypothetical protein
MTPERCPGCGTPLRPEMLACPNCPLSFPEDDGPKGSVNPLKQSRYYNFLLPAVFFGALGLGVWYMGAGLMHLGAVNSQPETGNPFDDKPSTAAVAAAAAAGNASSAAGTDGEAGDGSSGVARTFDSPAGDGGGEMLIISKLDENGTPIDSGSAAKAPRPAPLRKAPPPPRPPTEWKLRGAVYDLTTLKPLTGSALVFTDPETNRSVKTRTDSAGRYRAILPPLSDGRGYSVAVEKNGYSPNYLNPGTTGVREMAARERRSLARDLSSTLSAAPATVASTSEKPLVTDFYLAPRP